MIRLFGGSVPCLRPDRHEGPHLHKTDEESVRPGTYVIWQYDYCAPGTCERGCDSEDSEDYCKIFCEVPEEIALKLIATSELKDII